MRAFDLACSRPWAITEEWLQTILLIANREGEGAEAVATKLGRPLDNTHAVTVRDGVATVPIEGPIFRYASLFSDISGATSIEELATDFQQALDDPTIRAIVLHIDSPGGEVSGVNEFAQQIYDARGQKPITAYVGNQACSAGYWIASAASEIVCDPTAALGSIGVIMGVRDSSKQSAKDITFVSSQSPRKHPDPTTNAGQAQFQQHVDHLADVFVATVARNRGVTPEQVISDFGQGGVLIGQHAKDAGLADKTGSLEQTIASLSIKTVPLSPRGMRPLAVMKEHSMSGTEEQDHQAEGPEVARLRAQIAAMEEKNKAQAALLADEREKAITAQAEGFVASEPVTSRVFPRTAPTLTALYMILARDDTATPVMALFGEKQGGRVDGLKALIADLPPHKLTEERVFDPRSMVALNNNGGDKRVDQADELAKRRQNAKEYAEQHTGGNAK